MVDVVSLMNISLLNVGAMVTDDVKQSAVVVDSVNFLGELFGSLDMRPLFILRPNFSFFWVYNQLEYRLQIFNGVQIWRRRRPQYARLVFEPHWSKEVFCHPGWQWRNVILHEYKLTRCSNGCCSSQWRNNFNPRKQGLMNTIKDSPVTYDLVYKHPNHIITPPPPCCPMHCWWRWYNLSTNTFTHVLIRAAKYCSGHINENN